VENRGIIEINENQPHFLHCFYHLKFFKKLCFAIYLDGLIVRKLEYCAKMGFDNLN